MGSCNGAGEKVFAHISALLNNMVNPNSEGSLTFDVNNSFLIFPAEFQVIFLQNSFIRPSICAGLNLFKTLEQNITISITPDDPDPAYEEVKSEVDKQTKSSYFGGRLGAGVIASGSERHEWSLMIYLPTHSCVAHSL